MMMGSDRAGVMHFGWRHASRRLIRVELEALGRRVYNRNMAQKQSPQPDPLNRWLRPKEVNLVQHMD